jgi:glucose 1-dehydrogenase
MEGREKVAIITGAASGIGRSCVCEFVRAGYRVVMVDVNDKGLKELHGKLGADSAVSIQADVSEMQEVKRFVNLAAEKFGRLDVMINSSGICSNIPFLSLPVEEYDRIVRVNQYGTFYNMQTAANKMIELKSKGVIVNISSIFQEVVSPGVIHYHASKAAVSIMTKAAALELASYGIRVVGVAPGIIDTPMVQRDKELGIWDAIQEKHIRKKALQPEEVASVILFLCSEAANGINGNIIPIEDGLLSKY